MKVRSLLGQEWKNHEAAQRAWLSPVTEDLHLIPAVFLHFVLNCHWNSPGTEDQKVPCTSQLAAVTTRLKLSSFCLVTSESMMAQMAGCKEMSWNMLWCTTFECLAAVVSSWDVFDPKQQSPVPGAPASQLSSTEFKSEASWVAVEHWVGNLSLYGCNRYFSTRPSVLGPCRPIRETFSEFSNLQDRQC